MAHQIDVVTLRRGAPTLVQRVREWVEAIATATLNRGWAPYV
jgi:hypothetical protein